MHSVTNPLQACNDIFFKPGGVFTAVCEKNNWSWVAFIVVIVMALLPQYLFVNFVDIAWYQDLIISTEGDLSPAEIDQRRAFMTRSAFMLQHVVFTGIGFIVIQAIMALYLHLCTRNDDSHVFGFTDWYGFMWWTAMPAVINSLVAVALLLFWADHQVSPAILAPFSLAFVLGIEMSSQWYGVASGLSLITLWSIYLMAVGIARWTSFSTKKSVIIAAAPTVFFTSLFALFALT